MIGRTLDDWGTERLRPQDLWVLIQRWQKLPGNALAESLHGHAVPSWIEQVAAEVVDQLQGVNYALRGGKSTRPKRFVRWWEKVSQKFGSGAVPAAQFDDYW